MKITVELDNGTQQTVECDSIVAACITSDKAYVKTNICVYGKVSAYTVARGIQCIIDDIDNVGIPGLEDALKLIQILDKSETEQMDGDNNGRKQS